MNNLYGKDQTKPIAPAFMKNEAKTDIMDRTRKGGGALAHPILFARLGGAIDRANGIKPVAKAPNIGRPPMATTAPVTTPDRAAPLPAPVAPPPVAAAPVAAPNQWVPSAQESARVAQENAAKQQATQAAQEAQMRQSMAQMQADQTARAASANPPAAPVARPTMSPQEQAMRDQAMKQIGQGGLGAVLPPVQQPVMRQPVPTAPVGGFSIRPIGRDEATTSPVDPSMLRY